MPLKNPLNTCTYIRFQNKKNDDDDDDERERERERERESTTCIYHTKR